MIRRVLLTLLPLALACSAPVTPLNVVLVVVDTLRSDALGVYGSPENATPHLDALARRGVTFRTCVSQAPWTIPAFGSILTGEFPSSHGADWLTSPLSDSVPVLAERFQAAGWATAAFVSHKLVGRGYGFHRGFETFNEKNAVGHDHISSEILTAFATRWLDENERPFFLLVHYFDPHYNYMEHEGFTRTDSYDGAIEAGMDIWDVRAAELTRRDVDFLKDLYVGEIRFLDDQIGRLLRHLEESELTQSTLVVLTADHGEEFLEHGWLGHTTNLHGGLLRVPLMFTAPDRLAPRLEDAPAMLVDVHSSTLALAAGETFSTSGRDLFARSSPERTLIAEVAFAPDTDTEPEGAQEEAERVRQVSKLTVEKSVQRGPWKAIHDELSDSWELYDLEADPGELYDLSAELPKVLELLQRELISWQDSLPRAETGTVHLSEEDLARLRALGYTK